MNRPRIALLAVALGLSGTVTLQTLQSGHDVEMMTTAAGDFLASLSDAQQAQATFAFDSEERSRHHFIPPEVFERHGVSYADLGFEQKVRAQDLLRSGLSEQGYLTAQQIMEVEGILGVLVEGEGRQFSRKPGGLLGVRVRDAVDHRHVGMAVGGAPSLAAPHGRGRGDHREHADLPGRESRHRALGRAEGAAGR